MKAPTHLKTAHQADSVTSQNTWNFSNTAVRTSHLTRCLTVLLGCVELFERFRIYFDFLILLRAEEITKFQLGSNVKLIPVAIWHVHLFLAVWSVWLCYFITLLTDHPTADHMLPFCDEVASVMLYLQCTADDTCLNRSVLTDSSDIWHDYICAVKYVELCRGHCSPINPFPLFWYTTKFCLFPVFLSLSMNSAK